MRRLRCRLGWHAWRVFPIRNSLTPYCVCLYCPHTSLKVRWFPDRFRWFAYQLLTRAEFLERARRNVEQG